jgi:predicted nucleic acid-binding protein
MTLICLDTQILIWAIKEEAESGQEDMIYRSKFLIERLDKTNKRLLIPSVVVGEFLIRIPPKLHQTTTNLMQRNFILAEYDVRAASFYAKIWQSKRDRMMLDGLKSNGKTRQELKADRMIVATALANNAECIYSHDNGVVAFAQDYIDVRDVPPAPKQERLF